MYKRIRLCSLLLLSLLGALMLSACNLMIQAPPPPPPNPLEGKTVIASGLSQPRQIMYSNDGVLYIAENGRGGDATITVVNTSTVASGLTSQITAVASDGTQSVALAGLPSTATSPNGNNFYGAFGLYITDDSFWIAVGEGPEMKGHALTLFHNLIEVNRTTWRIQNIADIWSAAIAANQPSAESPFSNPADIAVTPDGVVLLADASCNCLWSWDETDGLQLAESWTMDDNPVPTSVAVGPDGDIYVGFLSGFPFPVGGTRIERWSNGELKQTYKGLTMVTDVLVTAQGEIYAVQFAEFGDKGPKPASGKVVKVTDSGVETIMEGLIAPYGLAQAPDGSLVVSVFSSGDTSGSGAVIKVE